MLTHSTVHATSDSGPGERRKIEPIGNPDELDDGIEARGLARRCAGFGPPRGGLGDRRDRVAPARRCSGHHPPADEGAPCGGGGAQTTHTIPRTSSFTALILEGGG